MKNKTARLLAGALSIAMALPMAAGASEEKEPVTFSLFVDATWFWFDEWGTDPVSQMITEKTGVSFDVTRATDGGQLPLLIASGDLPDIIYTGVASAMVELEDENVCYSYTDLVEQTGVDIYATEEEILNNTDDDGKYYKLLNTYAGDEVLAGPGTKSLFYRSDIYEEMGSPEINSIEELEKYLLDVKEKYPDSIPLLNDASYLWYFAEQLGVTGSEKGPGYDADGNPCYFLNSENIEEYFELLNRFAREGLITAEAQTYSYDKFREVTNSGNTAMILRASGSGQVANTDSKEAGSNYNWKMVSNELTETPLYPSTGIGWSGFYITKNCEDPERAIEFISWCRSEEGRKLASWGIEGVDWVYNEEGKTESTEAYRNSIADGKIRQADLGIGAWIFGDRGDENAWIDHAASDEMSLDVIERRENASENTVNWSELYFCIPKDGDIYNIYTALNDMYGSEIYKVIFAATEEEYESALATMYQKAEDIGLSELNAWMCEQLNARQ